MSSSGFIKLIQHLISHEKYLDTITDKAVSLIIVLNELQFGLQVVKIRQTSDKMITNNILTYLMMMIFTEISYTVRPLLEQETEVVRGNQSFFVKPMPLSTWFPFNSDRHFYVSQTKQFLKKGFFLMVNEQLQKKKNFLEWFFCVEKQILIGQKQNQKNHFFLGHFWTLNISKV